MIEQLNTIEMAEKMQKLYANLSMQYDHKPNTPGEQNLLKQAISGAIYFAETPHASKMGLSTVFSRENAGTHAQNILMAIEHFTPANLVHRGTRTLPTASLDEITELGDLLGTLIAPPSGSGQPDLNEKAPVNTTKAPPQEQLSMQ